MNDLIHSEGDWYLRKFIHSYNPDNDYFYIEHLCKKRPDLPENLSYAFTNRDHRYAYYAFNRPCYRCKRCVPEGLQGLFVLFTGDCET